jgi:hypothetical protein
MGAHLKTTIEISDSLLDQARRVAASEGTTLRALVDQGLRQVLASKRRGTAFKLRKASVKGRGLQPALQGADWERLRELAYDGRGT